MTYHSKAWAVWLLAALIPAILTQNPFYLLTIILAVGLNYFSLDRTSPIAQGWMVFLRLGLVLVLFSVLFNLLSVRAGATRLFTLPAWRWQTMTNQGQITVFQIGGKVSLESLIYGLNTGLALLAILLVFATFNSHVDHYQLLRSTPRFLYQSAIVISIAITFIPHMLLAQREIREAQALRGHRFRGIRDLVPLFVTLLAEGLERSITLAESMEARGFSSQRSEAAARLGLLLKSLVALSLLVLVGGALARSYYPGQALGSGLMAAGGLMLAAAIWRVGRGVQRSRYRRTLWRQRDSLVTGTALLTGLIISGIWLTNRAALIFYPYPRLKWPAFNLLITLSLLLLAAPAIAGRLTGESAHD